MLQFSSRLAAHLADASILLHLGEKLVQDAVDERAALGVLAGPAISMYSFRVTFTGILENTASVGGPSSSGSCR